METRIYHFGVTRHFEKYPEGLGDEVEVQSLRHALHGYGGSIKTRSSLVSGIGIIR